MSNYYDCPDCGFRTASSRGCGVCGRRSTAAELAANDAKDAAFDKRLRTMPMPSSGKETVHGGIVVTGPTLLDALTHAAAMDPTAENIAALTKYEGELRAHYRGLTDLALKNPETFVEAVLPDSEYEWADEDGHRVRRKRL